MSKDKKEQLTDLEMMNTPNDWPRWPYLPMKHRDRFKDNGIGTGLGLWVEIRGKYAFMRGANLFSPDSIRDAAIEYITAEQLLKEGWEVD